MKTRQKKPGRIKSVIRDWLGIGSQFAGGGYIGVESGSGSNVTPDTALTLSSVWACTRLISQTIATLPIDLYERAPDGSRSPVSDSHIARILHSSPNGEISAVVFWESVIGQMLLQGNGFAEKLRSGSRIVGLDLLSHERLTWRRDLDGVYRYTYVDLNGQKRDIPEEDIFHIPGFTLHGKFGMSAIRYGAQVLGSALAANDAANSTFKNGLMPTTYFKMQHTLKPEQREEFRENLKKMSGALKAGSSPLLEGGMEVGETGINPSDAQLLESRVFSIEEVCRWFGVPPSMIGSTDKASSWASSSENLNLWFLQYGLRPWLKRIEEAIWMQLLTPAEKGRYYAEFSVEGLLRADTNARANLYASALQNGWMNRNTVARLENAPLIPGGDVYTVQSNLIPLDQIGQQPPDGEQLRSALSAFMRMKEANGHED